MILDRGDGCIRCLVGPYRVHRSLSAERNAVVGAIALVGAIGVMVRSFQQRHVDILLRDVLDRGVTRSLNVRAFRVSAMTRPATDTVTRAGFESIVIGWLGPGSLIDLVSMALVVPAVDVNQCELCATRLKMANCGAALIHCEQPFGCFLPRMAP